MPFGLTNSPSSFQSLMNGVFRRLLRRLHVTHLREVLHLLRENQLFSKKSKCNFRNTQVEYLSHIISNGTDSMDSSKLANTLVSQGTEGLSWVIRVLQEVYKALWSYCQASNHITEEGCTLVLV
ncbi:reverse transcriptase [Gossypium australe]|uniref:Reverse transcriptase n=1 Tax=Gossypium australe TaxID=47621 RepID=A0A5B6V7S0_9ROSI|nr:reverse transcriptase [Gossypium australe]